MHSLMYPQSHHMKPLDHQQDFSYIYSLSSTCQSQSLSYSQAHVLGF